MWAQGLPQKICSTMQTPVGSLYPQMSRKEEFWSYFRMSVFITPTSEYRWSQRRAMRICQLLSMLPVTLRLRCKFSRKLPSFPMTNLLILLQPHSTTHAKWKPSFLRSIAVREKPSCSTSTIGSSKVHKCLRQLKGLIVNAINRSTRKFNPLLSISTSLSIPSK